MTDWLFYRSWDLQTLVVVLQQMRVLQTLEVVLQQVRVLQTLEVSGSCTKAVRSLWLACCGVDPTSTPLWAPAWRPAGNRTMDHGFPAPVLMLYMSLQDLVQNQMKCVLVDLRLNL